MRMKSFDVVLPKNLGLRTVARIIGKEHTPLVTFFVLQSRRQWGDLIINWATRVILILLLYLCLFCRIFVILATHLYCITHGTPSAFRLTG